MGISRRDVLKSAPLVAAIGSASGSDFTPTWGHEPPDEPIPLTHERAVFLIAEHASLLERSMRILNEEMRVFCRENGGRWFARYHCRCLDEVHITAHWIPPGREPPSVPPGSNEFFCRVWKHIKLTGIRPPQGDTYITNRWSDSEITDQIRHSMKSRPRYLDSPWLDMYRECGK